MLPVGLAVTTGARSGTEQCGPARAVVADPAAVALLGDGIAGDRPKKDLVEVVDGAGASATSEARSPATKGPGSGSPTVVVVRPRPRTAPASATVRGVRGTRSASAGQRFDDGRGSSSAPRSARSGYPLPGGSGRQPWSVSPAEIISSAGRPGETGSCCVGPGSSRPMRPVVPSSWCGVDRRTARRRQRPTTGGDPQVVRDPGSALRCGHPLRPGGPGRGESGAGRVSGGCSPRCQHDRRRMRRATCGLRRSRSGAPRRWRNAGRPAPRRAVRPAPRSLVRLAQRGWASNRASWCGWRQARRRAGSPRRMSSARLRSGRQWPGRRTTPHGHTDAEEPGTPAKADRVEAEVDHGTSFVGTGIVVSPVEAARG